MSRMLMCPKCGGNHTIVLRGQRGAGRSIRRERQCVECTHHFVTEETILQEPHKKAAA
jgi:transcriptional regulator NrdR family protein